jgi:hypothetical protein
MGIYYSTNKNAPNFYKNLISFHKHTPALSNAASFADERAKFAARGGMKSPNTLNKRPTNWELSLNYGNDFPRWV